MLQDQLLYFPSRAPLESVEAEARAIGITPWPEAGAAHRGFLFEPRGAAPAGTVVVFHGNAGQATDRVYWALALAELGWRTILAEYPGYGARDGSLGEVSMVADASETIRLARQAFGDPLVLAGESLGAGVAAAAAAGLDAPPAGLLLVTPWADLTSLAQEKFPLLPVRWILRDRYDTVANLASIACPVAICIAEQDEIIPPRHAERLFASLAEPKRCWRFAGCGHNDWPGGAAEPWWAEAMTFLSESKPRE